MEQDIQKFEFLKHAMPQIFILKGLWFEFYCMTEIQRLQVDDLVKFLFPERITRIKHYLRFNEKSGKERTN